MRSANPSDPMKDQKPNYVETGLPIVNEYLKQTKKTRGGLEAWQSNPEIKNQLLPLLAKYYEEAAKSYFNRRQYGMASELLNDLQLKATSDADVRNNNIRFTTTIHGGACFYDGILPSNYMTFDSLNVLKNQIFMVNGGKLSERDIPKILESQIDDICKKNIEEYVVLPFPNPEEAKNVTPDDRKFEENINDFRYSYKTGIREALDSANINAGDEQFIGFCLNALISTTVDNEPRLRELYPRPRINIRINQRFRHMVDYVVERNHLLWLIKSSLLNFTEFTSDYADLMNRYRNQTAETELFKARDNLQPTADSMPTRSDIEMAYRKTQEGATQYIEETKYDQMVKEVEKLNVPYYLKDMYARRMLDGKSTSNNTPEAMVFKTLGNPQLEVPTKPRFMMRDNQQSGIMPNITYNDDEVKVIKPNKMPLSAKVNNKITNRNLLFSDYIK